MNGDKERVEKEPGEGGRAELSSKPDKDQERLENEPKPKERIEHGAERLE